MGLIAITPAHQASNTILSASTIPMGFLVQNLHRVFLRTQLSTIIKMVFIVLIHPPQSYKITIFFKTTVQGFTQIT